MNDMKLLTIYIFLITVHKKSLSLSSLSSSALVILIIIGSIGTCILSVLQ